MLTRYHHLEADGRQKIAKLMSRSTDGNTVHLQAQKGALGAQ